MTFGRRPGCGMDSGALHITWKTETAVHTGRLLAVIHEKDQPGRRSNGPGEAWWRGRVVVATGESGGRETSAEGWIGVTAKRLKKHDCGPHLRATGFVVRMVDLIGRVCQGARSPSIEKKNNRRRITVNASEVFEAEREEFFYLQLHFPSGHFSLANASLFTSRFVSTQAHPHWLQ